jgi:hypothetical protein
MVAHDTSTFPVSTRRDLQRLPQGNAAKLKSMRGQSGFVGDMFHRAAVELGLRLNGSFFYPSEDRSILECLIIPYFQISAEHDRILFVGTDWYTQGYDRMFALKDMATVDPKPANARYGAPHHIVGVMSDMATHFQPGSLDLIMCNGVVGWGLNTVEDAETSFGAAFDALRPGGHLVVGWNDLEKHRPYRLSEISAIRRFETWTFPPMGTTQHLVDNAWRHVYSFYRKPE